MTGRTYLSGQGWPTKDEAETVIERLQPIYEGFAILSPELSDGFFHIRYQYF